MDTILYGYKKSSRPYVNVNVSNNTVVFFPLFYFQTKNRLH